MRRRKRNCVLSTLFAVTVCVAAGCTASPAGYHSADVECEAYDDSTAVELPEIDGEAEELATTESQEPDAIDEPAPPSEEEIAALGIREDMLAYWMVLNNKRAFVSWNEGGQKFFWNEFFWYIYWICEKYYAYDFMIVDMDGDGREEVVLNCSPGTTHVLHYEDGEVYGYWFGTRGMQHIHKNGIYAASDGASDNRFYRLTELNKSGYTEEMLAEMKNGYYEIGGKEATEEEFWDYWESLESVGQADRMDFAENMLDRQLLRNLSEQELALVKRIPVENMLENEPDYQEHKQALQSYAAVLKGEQDVILVSEDRSMDDDDTFAKYFSLADMDGDGSYELVFTCNDDLVWILHHEGAKIYGYPLTTQRHKWQVPVIATDGVFQTEDDSVSSTGYARIVSFEEDGCQIEPVEDYDISSHDWIRYYFYSEETIAQWLK